MTSPSRLLILSCSQRKRHEEGLLPAIERYDGPLFRILRRYLQSGAVNKDRRANLDIYILSAEFGLIPADRQIPEYERRMTLARAQELNSSVLESLRDVFDSNVLYREVFLCMGQDYQRSLTGWEAWRPSDLPVIEATGSLGGMQSQLHDWLYGASLLPRTCARGGSARIQGIDLDLSSQQVLEVARQALQNDIRGATDYRMWYVQIDDQRVSPKWVVSRLTGLPVGRFHSDSARQVLTRLGVQVHRANNWLREEKQ